MGIVGRGKEENKRYLQIQERVRQSAVEQARQRNVKIPSEAIDIAKKCDISTKREYRDYWDIANFLLAEYPTELGFYIGNSFTNFASQLGYDPFGKIMLATQYVDRLAGSPIMARLSFIKQYTKFYEFMAERHCPERTDKALEFLATAIFQFSDINDARKKFGTLIVVPEMEKGVKERLNSIDEAVAEYVTG